MWCTQSSQVQTSNNKDTPKQTIQVTLCQKQVKFCFLLSPSLTHSLTQSHISVTLWRHLLKACTVAIKRGRFPHSPILYNCFLYPRIVSKMKYGTAVLKSCRYPTWKEKKKEREFWNASLDANFRTFHCVSLCVRLSIHVSRTNLVRILNWMLLLCTRLLPVGTVRCSNHDPIVLRLSYL